MKFLVMLLMCLVLVSCSFGPKPEVEKVNPPKQIAQVTTETKVVDVPMEINQEIARDVPLDPPPRVSPPVVPNDAPPATEIPKETTIPTLEQLEKKLKKQEEIFPVMVKQIQTMQQEILILRGAIARERQLSGLPPMQEPPKPNEGLPSKPGKPEPVMEGEQ